MHRGCRKTETNAVNKSPFAGSFTAIVEPAEPRGPARVTRAVRMTVDRRQNVRESFIPPPINESAIVEPFARRSEYRIRDCGRSARNARLPNSSRLLATLDDVRFNVWALVHTKHRKRMKIRLP